MSAYASLQCTVYPQMVDLLAEFSGKILRTMNAPVIARYRLNTEHEQRLRFCGKQVSARDEMRITRVWHTLGNRYGKLGAVVPQLVNDTT